MNAVDRLLDLITTRFGLTLEDWSHAAIKEILSIKSVEQKKSIEEIAHLAEWNNEQLRELAGHLTVGESFFFRHPEHIAALLDDIRARLTAKGASGPITIWSAGCAGGQEPYSIAIACHEQLPPLERSRLTILATDLDSKEIERAERGRYFEWSFRGLSPERRERYFTLQSNNCFEINRSIREMVRFNCSTVQEQTAQALMLVDYIFFRNVSIYLKPESQKAIFAGFHRILNPGGLLFIAPSDAAPPRNYFRLAQGTSTSAYRAVRAEEVRSSLPALDALLHDQLRYNSSIERPHFHGNRSTKKRNGVTSIRDTRANEEVRAASLSSVRELDEHDGYLVLGQQRLADDQAEDAADAFRYALFLNPDDLLTRFWYAVSLQRCGVPKRSLMQIQKLFSTMNEMSKDALLSDGQTTVGALLDATQQLKEKLR